MSTWIYVILGIIVLFVVFVIIMRIKNGTSSSGGLDSQLSGIKSGFDSVCGKILKAVGC